ncbi:MOSC domain-containing protein [Marinobacterium sedimentorum]|uniref:MOSC domain-containing protein n=1 Tax=Marinobacterium sedimentorum TaxID=2927804 RepID=UPI0020C600B8|nr:MOSC domain-containing protein [Marinobacterium sedimentorum]MCP8688651.1 MOSC domain-containing protein [Marinobacterium sedimentorum]
MPYLSDLHIYPIKSTAGLRLERAFVEREGLAFDRRFILTDSRGRFLTARKHPALLRVRATPCVEGLILSATGCADMRLSYSQFSTRYQPVQVWDDEVQGQQCSEAADRWFSDYLGMPCQLLYFGSASRRVTALNPDAPVAFADGYPLLLIGQGSLQDLAHRCETPLSMGQFRPNLVIADSEPYAEDHWKRIRIGSLELEFVKPCSRCVMVNLDSQTALANPQQQPLRTLAKYRRGEKGQVLFGQNLVPMNEAVLEVGMEVEILELWPANSQAL